MVLTNTLTRCLARSKSFWLLVVASLLVLTSILSHRSVSAQGNRIFVNGNIDISADGQCSLIEALENANAVTKTEQHADCMTGVPNGPDIIVLAEGAVYDLSHSYGDRSSGYALPPIVGTLTIEGRGATIRRAVGAATFRLFHVPAESKLFLHDVTLDLGDPTEGAAYRLEDAVHAEGELHLSNSGLAGQIVAAIQSDGSGQAQDTGSISAAATFGPEFRILSPLGTNATVVEHSAVTGDDRGGIAVSDALVFYSGDSGTGRFALHDLSNGTRLTTPIRDSMVSDLLTGIVYSLGTGPNTVFNGGFGQITHLIELDSITLARTGNSIQLSAPIMVSYDSGIFAGYGRIVIWSAYSGNAFDIQVPSGQVTDLGYQGYLQHNTCENWAYWGVAEHFDNAIYLVYVRDFQTIVRTNLDTQQTTVFQTFSNLNDMCSITVSPVTQRWYFHHEDTSQFASGDEIIGSAPAILVGSGDTTRPFPTPLLSKQPLGSLVYDPAQTVVVGPDITTSLTLTLDADQTLSIIANPEGNVQPKVEIFGTNQELLAEADAVVPGSTIVLNNTPVEMAGIYTVKLSSVAGPSGLVNVNAILNAAVEEEEYGGPKNNRNETAQNIETSFMQLPGGAERGAAWGAAGRNVSLRSPEFSNVFYNNIFNYDFSNLPEKIGAARLEISALADLGDTFEYLTVDVEGLVIENAFEDDGEECSAATTSIALSSEEVATLVADGMISVQVAPNFEMDGCGGDTLQIRLIVGVPFTPDYYAFDLQAGQGATFAVSGPPGGTYKLDLENETGKTVAKGTAAPQGSNVDQYISQFVAPATGSYRVRVNGAQDYTLVIVRDGLFDLESNNSPENGQDLQPPSVVLGNTRELLAFGEVVDQEPNDSIPAAQHLDYEQWSLNFNDDIGDMFANTSRFIPHVSILGTGNSTADFFAFNIANPGLRGVFDIDHATAGLFDSYIRLYDAEGNLIAENDDTPLDAIDNGSESSLDSYLEHTFAQAGTFFLEVGSCCVGPVPVLASYTLHISLKQQPLRAHTRDFYRFDLTAGTVLNLMTYTPGDGPGEFVNELDPVLELFGPDGQVVASDDNGAADKRNAILTYEVDTADLYAVSVSGVNSAGEYVLTANEQLLAVKTSTDNPMPVGGDVVMYTITLENRAGGPSTGVAVSYTLASHLMLAGPVTLDPPDPNADIAQSQADLPELVKNLTVAPGTTTTISFLAQVDEDVEGGTELNNSFSVTSDQRMSPQLGTSSVIVEEVPDIAVTKNANVASATVGDTISYTVQVTNTGNVRLSSLVADDAKLGPLTLGTSDLDPGQATTLSATYTVTETDLPGPIGGSVTVTGTTPMSETVQATDSALVTLTSESMLLVTKIANVDTARVGEMITYTYAITNSGNVSINDLMATDDLLGPISLDTQSLAPGEMATGLLTHTVQKDDLPGPIVNTVTVTATTSLDQEVQGTATTSVSLSVPDLYIPVIRNEIAVVTTQSEVGERN